MPSESGSNRVCRATPTNRAPHAGRGTVLLSPYVNAARGVLMPDPRARRALLFLCDESPNVQLAVSPGMHSIYCRNVKLNWFGLVWFVLGPSTTRPSTDRVLAGEVIEPGPVGIDRSIPARARLCSICRAAARTCCAPPTLECGLPRLTLAECSVRSAQMLPLGEFSCMHITKLTSPLSPGGRQHDQNFRTENSDSGNARSRLRAAPALPTPVVNDFHMDDAPRQQYAVTALCVVVGTCFACIIATTNPNHDERYRLQQQERLHTMREIASARTALNASQTSQWHERAKHAKLRKQLFELVRSNSSLTQWARQATRQATRAENRVRHLKRDLAEQSERHARATRLQIRRIAQLEQRLRRARAVSERVLKYTHEVVRDHEAMLRAIDGASDEGADAAATPSDSVPSGATVPTLLGNRTRGAPRPPQLSLAPAAAATSARPQVASTASRGGGWTRHGHTNCYPGQGGVDVPSSPAHGAATTAASAQACIERCAANRKPCTAVVVRPLLGGAGKVECWLRAAVNIRACDAAARRFHTYTNNVASGPSAQPATSSQWAQRVRPRAVPRTGLRARMLLGAAELGVISAHLGVTFDPTGRGWLRRRVNGTLPPEPPDSAAIVFNPHVIDARLVLLNVRRLRRAASQGSSSISGVDLVLLAASSGGHLSGTGAGGAQAEARVVHVIPDAEDARVVRWRGRSLVFFSRYAARGAKAIWLAEIDDKQAGIHERPIRQQPLKFAEQRRSEGNWLPFVYAGRVYVSYTLCPHTVLAVSPSTGDCTRVHSTMPSGCSVADRGSASGVADFDGDGAVVGLGHHRGGGFQYYHWLFKREASPPFRILARSRRFRLPRFLALQPGVGPHADDCQYSISLRAEGAPAASGRREAPDRQALVFDFGAADRVALTATWSRSFYCQFTGWCTLPRLWPNISCHTPPDWRNRPYLVSCIPEMDGGWSETEAKALGLETHGD